MKYNVPQVITISEKYGLKTEQEVTKKNQGGAWSGSSDPVSEFSGAGVANEFVATLAVLTVLEAIRGFCDIKAVSILLKPLS